MQWTKETMRILGTEKESYPCVITRIKLLSLFNVLALEAKSVTG
jgi:hypothetical protein